jgi:hypothetical protein
MVQLLRQVTGTPELTIVELGGDDDPNAAWRAENPPLGTTPEVI